MHLYPTSNIYHSYSIGSIFPIFFLINKGACPNFNLIQFLSLGRSIKITVIIMKIFFINIFCHFRWWLTFFKQLVSLGSYKYYWIFQICMYKICINIILEYNSYILLFICLYKDYLKIVRQIILILKYFILIF